MSSPEDALLCRLCAESFAKEISNNMNESINVVEKIYQYFQINISENDILPKDVCRNCYQKVFDTCEFHQQIKNAQNILQAKLVIKCEEVDVKSEDITSYDSWFYDDDEPLSNHIVAKNELKDESLNEKNKTLNVLKASNELRKYYWKCFECEDKIFKTIEKLKLHFEDIHCETPVQYVCLKCSENFHTIDQLQSHIHQQQHSIHNDQSVVQIGDKYVCDTCKKEFSSRKNILVHRFIHLGIKRYSCNECGKSFMQRPHLKNHMAIHSDATPFSCTQCQKKFKTKDNLRIHMRSHVPKETRLKFECDVCQKKFTSTSNLNYHKKIHSGIPEFTCEYCGKRFLHKGNLQEHTLIHSTDVGSYHCEQCPKTFKNISRLRQHQLRFHSHTKPHICDVCEKRFRIKSELIEHKRIHSGELPFECDFCTKKFRLKKTLKIHLRQHTGEKPYFCTNCNHHFTNSSNFNKHLKIRHGGGVSADNKVTITSNTKTNILTSSS